MKYRCLVCGQEIDNNEMCPYCGSDFRNIVPIEGSDEEENYGEPKGHYRCLVCGRESEDGDTCPYCGSEDLYNLGQEETYVEEYEEPEFEEEVAEEEPVEEEVEEEIEDENIREEEEESLETKYFNKFRTTLPLDSIDNPDPSVIEKLYEKALETGVPVSPLEVVMAFAEKDENEEPVEEFEEESVEEIAEEEPVEEEIEEPVLEEVPEEKEEVVVKKVEPKVEEKKAEQCPLEASGIKHEEVLSLALYVKTTKLLENAEDDIEASILKQILKEVENVDEQDPKEGYLEFLKQAKNCNPKLAKCYKLLKALYEED